MNIFLDYDRKKLGYLKNYKGVAESVKQICLKYDHTARIIVFGSTVRGNWTGDSDIDLLIVLDTPDAKDRIAIEIWKTVEAPVEIHFATSKTLKEWYMRFIDVYEEI